MEKGQELFYLRKIEELKDVVKQIAPKLPYHNLVHLTDVSKACKRYAELEGLNSYQIFILETAGLLHDIVYVQGRSDNEEKSAEAARKILSKLDYSVKEIEEVSRLILATKSPRSRKDILGMIINDADLDNLGRNDFFKKSEFLKEEVGLDNEKWKELQIDFLNRVKYHTDSAKKLREAKLKENLEKIRRAKWQKSKMLVAGWSLTKVCNLNCIHCYNASGKRDPNELSLKQCFKVVNKLKKAGVVAINFGGGECALRSDFIELCKYIKSRGIAISYTTNGTTFKIIEKHLHLFHDIGVSIDFGDAEKHNWFRGRKGTFKQAVDALKVLVKKKINNEIVTCLTKLNCSEKELQKLYRLAEKLGVDSWRLNRFRANGRGIKNERLLKLSKKDLKNAFTFLSKYTNGSVLTPEPIFRAAFGGTYYIAGDPSGFTSFRIQTNGEVSPSVFLSESGGNIKYESVEKIMNSAIFRKIRNRVPVGKCKKCKEYYHCRGGDAGASYLKYRHFNGPDPSCWLKASEKKPEVKQGLKKDWNVHELYLCTLYIPIKEKNGK